MDPLNLLQGQMHRNKVLLLEVIHSAALVLRRLQVDNHRKEYHLLLRLKIVISSKLLHMEHHHRLHRAMALHPPRTILSLDTVPRQLLQLNRRQLLCHLAIPSVDRLLEHQGVLLQTILSAVTVLHHQTKLLPNLSHPRPTTHLEDTVRRPLLLHSPRVIHMELLKHRLNRILMVLLKL